MDVVHIALRIIHIVSGVIWAGGAALFFFYVEPTLNRLGPAGASFAEEAIVRRRLPTYFMVASTLTVLGGVILYWQNSSGLSNAWTTSPAGLAFGLGGLAAIVAWLGGNLLIPRHLEQLRAIGAEIAAAGGPPSAELGARLRAAQDRLRLIGATDLVLIGLAVVAMAVARYL